MTQVVVSLQSQRPGYHDVMWYTASKNFPCVDAVWLKLNAQQQPSVITTTEMTTGWNKNNTHSFLARLGFCTTKFSLGCIEIKSQWLQSLLFFLITHTKTSQHDSWCVNITHRLLTSILAITKPLITLQPVAYTRGLRIKKNLSAKL